ncbi:MAG: helix-turn-helix transcriptional regulator [Crocosphaera sp.]|nr:helix-turn-helix transcriptional regulator [Crocosphaera sp.]
MTQCLMRVSLTILKDYPGLGSRIKKARQESPLSLTELAARAKISVAHWNRVENEKVKDLPLETLRGIEQSLNIDLGVSFDD